VIGSTGRTAGTSYERRKACCPSRVAPTYPAVEALCAIMLSLSTFLGIGVGSSVKTTDFGGDSVFRSGAPRPTKMGTIASPWRYDAAARHALQSEILRRPAILRCDSWAGRLANLAMWSAYFSDDLAPLQRALSAARAAPCRACSALASTHVRCSALTAGSIAPV
jgi:hypothetical protein